MGRVYREMRLSLTDRDECRTLIWALGQMRQVVEAKMYFELQGLNTKKGAAEITNLTRLCLRPTMHADCAARAVPAKENRTI
jgi:hypothetical protein